MTEVFPLFICCHCARLTFEIESEKDCHWHCAGFRENKKISKDLRKAALEGLPNWKKMCEQNKKVQK